MRGERLFRQLTSPFRLLPDFLLIGAQRGGTTSLYSYLTRHPSVLPSHHKEIHFFDQDYQKGTNWYRSNFPTIFRKYWVQRRLSGPVETGEASPYYFFHPLVARRVAQTLKDIKLILLLRNPIDRAYSHYQLSVRLGREQLSFEEAIEKEPTRLAGERDKIVQTSTYRSFNYQNYSYLTRGRYIRQIQRWLQYFSREQMLILKSQDLYTQPQTALQQVEDFLELPPFDLQNYKVYNQGQYAPLSQNLRADLRAHFEPFNQELYQFLDRDLAWK